MATFEGKNTFGRSQRLLFFVQEAVAEKVTKSGKHTKVIQSLFYILFCRISFVMIYGSDNHRFFAFISKVDNIKRVFFK
jgi:hypothetical protein